MNIRNRGISTAAILAIVIALAVVAWLFWPTSTPEPVAPPAEEPAGLAGMVDDERINRADIDDPGAWLTYGRTYEEQRFSPLDQINQATVSGLGVAWTKELNTPHKVEATPLIVDGVMYFSTPWNITYALDAVTGDEIWTYDPEVPGATAREACCGVVSRGIAVYRGRVYLATLDGRLLALDAANGAKIWEVDTIIDRSRE